MGFTMIELLLVIMIIGILAAIAIPVLNRVQHRAKEARVRSNCHAVQLAVEDFAIQVGQYPIDTDTDVTPSNRTVVDLLSDGLLENPFTNTVSQPLGSGAAANPGETGYVPFVGASGTRDGYTITGFGKTNIVITVTNGI